MQNIADALNNRKRPLSSKRIKACKN